jgi:hypothetical protein
MTREFPHARSHRLIWLLYANKVNPRIDLLMAYHKPADPFFWFCGE